ncbi:uncharacterized protein LOC118439366 [Folsomia candida]|uniref:uncharacterized protein LOC118439366 n=1 Tax=Folsomia candida TaxID=158441 RepID=UPI001604B6D6|nr:uncharacterized protein LOC118439366 [Folsomia candida]
MKLSLPTYPDEIVDVFRGLLGGMELYKGLKTLTILSYHGPDETHDLTEIEMELFKQLLFAMDGMDEVEIGNLCFSEESARDMFEFMEAHKMSVSKFKIFEGMECHDFLEI